jgi:hypothetical protein
MMQFSSLIFFSGITLIGHNSESAINVGHCLDPGCYTRSIAYEASSKQISALIELSDECRQSIKVLFIKSSIMACFLTIWIMTISMSVFRLHLNLTRSLIPGGMTRTDKRNTTGRETTMLLIRASAALTILASTLTSNATATPSHPATYPTTVWYIFSGKKCV